MKNNTKKIILTALFAAITYIATIIIQIPSPMEGYINLGDCIVLLSAWLLGPVYGTLAAAVGSGLADILTGYGYYAPGTIVIKSVMAIVAYYIFKFSFKKDKNKIVYNIFSGVTAELIMVLGYFLYACLILGNGLAAALSIPGNLVQGLAGLITAVIIYQPLKKLNIIEKS